MISHASIPFPSSPPSRDALDVIAGAGLRDIITRRIFQIDEQGFSPARDLQQHPGWMVLGALEELRRAHGEIDGPRLLRVDPGHDSRATVRGYLVDAIALAWAAIDRIDAQITPAMPTAPIGEQLA